MKLSKRELFLNTLYSSLAGFFVFSGVFWGIKYSLLISTLYGFGFFAWSELFLYTLKLLTEDGDGRKDG